MSLRWVPGKGFIKSPIKQRQQAGSPSRKRSPEPSTEENTALQAELSSANREVHMLRTALHASKQRLVSERNKRASLSPSRGCSPDRRSAQLKRDLAIVDQELGVKKIELLELKEQMTKEQLHLGRVLHVLDSVGRRMMTSTLLDEINALCEEHQREDEAEERKSLEGISRSAVGNFVHRFTRSARARETSVATKSPTKLLEDDGFALQLQQSFALDSRTRRVPSIPAASSSRVSDDGTVIGAAKLPVHTKTSQSKAILLMAQQRVAETRPQIRAVFDKIKSLHPGFESQLLDAYEPLEFDEGDIVVGEAQYFRSFFVVHSGCFHARRDGVTNSVQRSFTSGDYFGSFPLESASAKSTCAIICKRPGRVFALSLAPVQRMVHSIEASRHVELDQILSSVPLLRSLNADNRSRLVSALEVRTYAPGDVIIKQGEHGDHFFICQDGVVDIVKENVSSDGTPTSTVVGTYSRGSYFGERALMFLEPRAATVRAQSHTKCFVLSRDNFNSILGSAKEMLQQKITQDQRQEKVGSTEEKATAFREKSTETVWPMRALSKKNARPLLPVCCQRGTSPVKDLAWPFSTPSLSNVICCRALHRGGMACLFIVKAAHCPVPLVLKCTPRVAAVAAGVVERAVNAQAALLTLRPSPFIAEIISAFHDPRWLYTLLPLYPGGSLHSLRVSQQACRFSDKIARYYCACMIEAVQALEKNGILYRDLRPENVLLDDSGRPHLIDFNSAKLSSRSFSSCGVAEYAPPEVVRCQSHGRCAIYWQLGIFAYELLTGRTPFWGPTANIVSEKVLAGLLPQFPGYISDEAAKFIRGLLKVNVSERLGGMRGIRELQGALWMKGMVWGSLERIAPPLPPDVLESVVTTAEQTLASLTEAVKSCDTSNTLQAMASTLPASFVEGAFVGAVAPDESGWEPAF